MAKSRGRRGNNQYRQRGALLEGLLPAVRGLQRREALQADGLIVHRAVTIPDGRKAAAKTACRTETVRRDIADELG